MNCNIVHDLLPLYIDGCCSEESKTLIKEHIGSCQNCHQLFEALSTPTDLYADTATNLAPTFHKIKDWKASILQSVLLFFSFALITLGVALEARLPYSLSNGIWARNLIIPATGFLLSLANWYFIPVYKNRRIFSNCSLLATLAITLLGYLWASLHFGMHYRNLFPELTFGEVLSAPNGFLLLNGLGLILVVAFSLGSKILSDLYARMLGKE